MEAHLPLMNAGGGVLGEERVLQDLLCTIHSSLISEVSCLCCLLLPDCCCPQESLVGAFVVIHVVSGAGVAAPRGFGLCSLAPLSSIPI